MIYPVGSPRFQKLLVNFILPILNFGNNEDGAER